MNKDIHNSTHQVSARFPDLAGKVALVTGSGRGIGQGIAAFLGRQGMKLVLVDRIEEADQTVCRELAEENIETLWVTADLADTEEAEKVFTATLERFGTIDLLVNNAAQLRSAPFLELEPEMYSASFENNVRIVYHLSFRSANLMAEKHSGVIVNISSVGGLRAHRGTAGYDASKGAVDALTRSMAVDLAPHGIRVNAVAPGLTWSQPLSPKTSAVRAKKVEGIPLGRAGTPEDIGATVAFLASDAGAYITGQILYVDGGLTAQLTPPGIFI